MIIFSSVFQDRYPKLTYDRLFRKEYGFNNKLHRDDREHAKSRGLLVNDEVGINNKLILKCLPLYIYCHLTTGLSDCCLINANSAIFSAISWQELVNCQ